MHPPDQALDLLLREGEEEEEDEERRESGGIDHSQVVARVENQKTGESGQIHLPPSAEFELESGVEAEADAGQGKDGNPGSMKVERRSQPSDFSPSEKADSERSHVHTCPLCGCYWRHDEHGCEGMTYSKCKGCLEAGTQPIPVQKSDEIDDSEHDHACPHCGLEWSHEDSECDLTYERACEPCTDALGDHDHACPNCGDRWRHFGAPDCHDYDTLCERCDRIANPAPEAYRKAPEPIVVETRAMGPEVSTHAPQVVFTGNGIVTDQYDTSRAEEFHMSNAPAIASIVFLALALLVRWPYGFYTLLRFVVCGSAIYLSVQANRLKKKSWVWIMVATAVLFNPLIPVHLSRSDWQPLDFVGAVVFAVALVTIRRKE